MSNDLGKSVWFSGKTSAFCDIVAILCRQQIRATLTFADGSDHVGTLSDLEDGELWYRATAGSGVDTTDRYEGVPIEYVLAIRVL